LCKLHLQLQLQLHLPHLHFMVGWVPFIFILTRCPLLQAYTNELENKVARLEEENQRLRKLKVRSVSRSK